MVEPAVGTEIRDAGNGAIRLLDTAVERTLRTVETSGSRLERVLLANGQALVLKHVDARAATGIVRATGDSGRVSPSVGAPRPGRRTRCDPPRAGGWRGPRLARVDGL